MQFVDAADAPYLDLRTVRELQEYNLLKGRLFTHTPMIDSNLLKDISMDSEFKLIFQAIGWKRVDPLEEEGSRTITLQFLCTLAETDNGISF